jgi:hypothetical protein
MEEPQIDWKHAPKEAHWWAMDMDGRAHWFMEPNVISYTDFWYADLVEAPTFGYHGFWKTSLRERP